MQLIRQTDRQTPAPRPSPVSGTLPFALCSPAEFAATCSQAILDTDPSGSGLGVWVLVETEPGFCIYEYAGGIT
jgi:hypothetical protein